MPCDSGGYEPSPYECKIKETVKLLCYVYNWLGTTISNELHNAVYDTIYFNKQQGNKWVNALCTVLKDTTDDDRDQLIYNNRVRLSRRLADWWEDHVEADNKKLEFEKRNEIRKAIQILALGKLTKEEQEVLGLC